jgi:hypothetical protein
MFARKVAARLKPNSLPEFTNLMEREILPWLRQQEGFLDLITLSAPDGTEVATISFWDHKGNALAYNSGGYPEVLKTLEDLLDGTPYVKTFDVVGSTFQRAALAPLTEAENQLQESLVQQSLVQQNLVQQSLVQQNLVKETDSAQCSETIRTFSTPYQ